MDDAPKVIMTTIRHGDVTYEGGDLYDEKAFANLSERQAKMLVDQGIVQPLTKGNYTNAIARRPPNTLGRGFTRRYLQDLGILDDKPEPEGQFHPRDTDVIRNGYIMRPRRAGVTFMWRIFRPDGTPVQDKEIRGAGPAEAFVDSLDSVKEVAKEPADDLHVQAGSH